MIIDDMLEKGLELFKEDPNELRELKFKATEESLMRQFKNCALYRQFCKKEGFDPRRDFKSAENFKDIPYLTTANFKGKTGRPKELLTVPEDEIVFWGLSSGTSGDPSMVGRDKINMKRSVRIMKLVELFSDIIDYDWCLLYMPPPPKHYTQEFDEVYTGSYFMYLFDVTNHLAPEERIFTLKMGDQKELSAAKRYEFDAMKTIGFLKSKPGTKGVGNISGSVPLIYSTLMGYYKKTGETFECGENTKLVSGGGWKSFSGEAVSAEEFRANIAKILGIQTKYIRDVYNFTETDCVFAECEHHNKHVPPWCEVIIRDTETMEPVKTGEKGLVNIINPVAHSYAGVSILQDDIARIVMEDGCPCGNRGAVLEVFGRAEGAEAKGCGAQVAEMTKEE